MSLQFHKSITNDGSEKGTMMVEYGLIVSLVAVALAVVVGDLRAQVGTSYIESARLLNEAVGAGTTTSNP